MKQNFNKSMYDFKGLELRDEEGVITLATVAINALTGVYEDERGLSGEEKVKREALAHRIYKEPEGEFTAEEIALVKTLINKLYVSPILVAAAYRAIES